MAIGLIIVGAVITVFVSNGRSFAASEGLGRIPENSRVAFELMARDIREAAGNPCEANLPVYNAINNSATKWYTDLSTPMLGYSENTGFPDAPFGTGVGERLSSTDAIELKSAVSNVTPIAAHDPGAKEITLGTSGHGFVLGDLAVACDFGQAAVFQINDVSGDVIGHAANSGAPGNCSSGLGWQPSCTSPGVTYAFGCYLGKWDSSDCADETPVDGSPDRWSASIAKLHAARWYVGNNPHGDSSLYRSVLRNVGGTLSIINEEIAEGVQDMNLTYLVRGADQYISADLVNASDWQSGNVIAARIDLTLRSYEKVDGKTQSGRLTHIVSIRSRNP